MKNSSLKPLLASFCLSFSALLQAQAPVADFELCTRVIEQYSSLQINDLSTNSPYQWEWDVYDSTTYASTQFYPSLLSGDLYSDPWGNGNDEYSRNPEFSFDLPGCYTVLLKATNASGTGMKVKKCYILVIAPEDYYLGYGTYGINNDNHIVTDYGRIGDDGGPNLNYGSNQNRSTRSYLKITPANKQNITLKIQQIRLADVNDSLCVYDDDTVNNAKILGIYTSANNGQTPTLNSTSPKMYIIFNSNSSGVDSGYTGYFYTQSGTPFNPTIDFSYSPSLSGNPTTFHNEFKALRRFTFEMRWTVDDTLQTNYINADSMVYTFNNTNAYQVCLEAYNCDTSIKTCKTINAISNLARAENKSVHVYPNPFLKHIQIDLPKADMQAIRVFNLQGQELNYRVEETESGYKIHFEPTLNQGLYLLQITYADGAVGLFKLVK